jgi:thiol-disulfide isomerase/thioredoxin
MKVCPTGAITWKGGKVFLDPVMEVGKSSAARTERARLRKRAKLARTVLAISMVALLGGALYYYNVVDKIPEVNATPDTEEDANIDGVVIPSGNTVGTLCYTMDRPLVGGDESVNAREYRGKVTIINFWGTWCGPCKAELPDFDRIATDYADDVKIIAYHSDYAKNSALDYVQENFPDSNMIFATDEGDAYYTMLGGEGSYPMTWVLDENGVIIAQYVGMVHYDTLKGHIEAELQK